MKIRIQKDTLRLRLKKSEIEILSTEKKYTESISLGSNTLYYTIAITSAKEIETTFLENKITVSIPQDMALIWINTNLISLRNKGNKPSVLIEKDFACSSSSCKETEAEKQDSFTKPSKHVGR